MSLLSTNVRVRNPTVRPLENYTVKTDELNQNYTKIFNVIPCTVSRWMMTSAYVIYPNRSDRWPCQYTSEEIECNFGVIPV